MEIPKNKDKKVSAISFRAVNLEISALRHFFNLTLPPELFYNLI
jgi:hypothetical protein